MDRKLTCSHCGAARDLDSIWLGNDDILRCTACGRDRIDLLTLLVDVQKDPAGITFQVCPACGPALAFGARYCYGCGIEQGAQPLDSARGRTALAVDELMDAYRTWDLPRLQRAVAWLAQTLEGPT